MIDDSIIFICDRISAMSDVDLATIVTRDQNE